MVPRSGTYLGANLEPVGVGGTRGLIADDLDAGDQATLANVTDMGAEGQTIKIRTKLPDLGPHLFEGAIGVEKVQRGQGSGAA